MKSIIAYALASLALMLAGCASPVGKAKFPQASADFVPKQTYAVANDKLWEASLAALDKNRLAIASSDKASGIIQSDYIEGQASLIAGGLVASQSTRYKFNLALRNQTGGGVKLNILCKIESSMTGRGGSSQWTDVSSQNQPLALKLETWLYEQVEQGL